MSFNTNVDFNQFLHASVFLKYGLLSVIILYIIFLFVVLKQVRSMNHIITQPFFAKILTGIAFSLLFFGISLFAIAIVIL